MTPPLVLHLVPTTQVVMKASPLFAWLDDTYFRHAVVLSEDTPTRLRHAPSASSSPSVATELVAALTDCVATSAAAVAALTQRARQLQLTCGDQPRTHKLPEASLASLASAPAVLQHAALDNAVEQVYRLLYWRCSKCRAPPVVTYHKGAGGERDAGEESGPSGCQRRRPCKHVAASVAALMADSTAAAAALPRGESAAAAPAELPRAVGVAVPRGSLRDPVQRRLESLLQLLQLLQSLHSSPLVSTYSSTMSAHGLGAPLASAGRT